MGGNNGKEKAIGNKRITKRGKKLKVKGKNRGRRGGGQ